ncbi:MAG: hypothetical protein ACE5GW_02820, partial [Planctomycetota bacterium]
SDPTHGHGNRVDVVFLSDYDASGRQRLRLVRTLAGEMRHPITQFAGALTGGMADYDYIDDSLESEMGILRAPGGLQEVAYLMDPDPNSAMLWRGVKSPIGGDTTLFDDDSIYAGEAASAPMRCRPLADGILYLEHNFWGPATASWERGGDGAAEEPFTWWDSTRAILAPAAGGRESAGAFDPGSRHEPRDDIFPSRVQIVLVLRPARATRLARITRFVDEMDTEIRVDSTDHYPAGAFQYLRIDDEWLRYGSKQGKTFLEVERGVRGTAAAEHEAGTPVVYGSTFSRVVRVPGARFSRWGER